MAIEVKAWKAEDGTLHETECAAATRDVAMLVEQSPLAENSPFARKLVEWLTQNAPAIRHKLEAHERACPTACANPAGTMTKGVGLTDYANPAHSLHSAYREGWKEKHRAPSPYAPLTAQQDAFDAGQVDHHLKGIPLVDLEPDSAFQTASGHNDLVANKD